MTGYSCPECSGSGKVVAAEYDRTQIVDLTNEEVWMDNQTDNSHIPRDQTKAVTCRVCWGRGTI